MSRTYYYKATVIDNMGKQRFFVFVNDNLDSANHHARQVVQHSAMNPLGYGLVNVRRITKEEGVRLIDLKGIFHDYS